MEGIDRELGSALMGVRGREMKDDWRRLWKKIDKRVKVVAVEREYGRKSDKHIAI